MASEIDVASPPERASPPRRLHVVQLDGRLSERERLREREVPPGGVGSPSVTARVVDLSPGPANLASLSGDGDGWLGLLMLQGVLIVETESGRARVGWALGEGDLFRPWDLVETSLTRNATWRVLTSCRLALLDAPFATQIRSMPALLGVLVERTASTTRWLLAKSLVLSSPLVEERLLLLFALLAEKWGRVTSYGVRIDLPVTHELLAILCGARRPSVTLALRSLTRQQLIARGTDGRWILRRELSANGDGRPSCWAQYADALGLSDG